MLLVQGNYPKNREDIVDLLKFCKGPEKWHATLTTISPPKFSLNGATTRYRVEVKCTRTKNPSFTTSESSYHEWTKPDHSKYGHTFPSMTDTGDT